jgi:hypothetical protein
MEQLFVERYLAKLDRGAMGNTITASSSLFEA